MRQSHYEHIVDETLFIARASEGSVSADWIMNQPIFVRQKYVKAFEQELKERQEKMNSNK
jgi:hypothetical protein